MTAAARPPRCRGRSSPGCCGAGCSFGGVTITDALGATTGHDETTAGVLAAAAGSDILLFTDSAPGELSALRAALGHGQIARAGAVAAYRRIVALKRKLGLG